MVDINRKKFVRHGKEWQRRWFMFSALILPVIGFLVFFVYVNVDSILMAFQQPDYSSGGLKEVYNV